MYAVNELLWKQVMAAMVVLRSDVPFVIHTVVLVVETVETVLM